MRRVLLGGFGIALGVLARPAVAQDFPGQPIPVQTSPATRAARLGAPVAVPDSPPVSDVTPAGLVARGQVAPAGAGVPVVTTVPLGTFPAVGPPVVVVPQTGAPWATPLPQPRTFNAVPSLTEIRGPATGGVPTVPVTPLPGTTTPGTLGVPSVVDTGMPIIPGVGPDDCGPGIPCPQPALDAPLYGDPPRLPGLSRLFGLGAADRHWLGAEYLLWWTKSTQLPPVLTTGTPASMGIPGVPGTVTIFDGDFGKSLHGGARFSGGWWFSDDQRRGIDTSFMFLFRNGASFAASTEAFPLLARPFFNANAPTGPFAEVVAAPGLASGGVVTQLENSLWGADVNYRRFLAGNPCARLDGIAGFRYLNFKETLTITESFVRTPGSPMDVGVPAVAGTITDRFRTENNFYGGQVGLVGEVRRGRWFVNGRSSIAFGTVNQTAEIAGGQGLLFPNGTVAQYQGGLLALPGANIGRFSQNKFAVLPEVGLNLGYHVTPNWRVFVGYNFLYLSSVVRAADMIDTTVDAARIPNFPLPGSPAVLPGPARPSPQFHTSDFWAQGINFGMQWTW